MRRPKLVHPVTADHRREIDIRVLANAGAFKAPGMRFPFQHLESAPDHIASLELPLLHCTPVRQPRWCRLFGKPPASFGAR
jgi:hypothetical protein